ncbi:MAG: hypothetical protein LBH32_12500 [Dysgonamonadaceae bacterium]|jgi:hypothetical protein|nr:hypothetical protein [Dysgonamonadaceae bacterium]
MKNNYNKEKNRGKKHVPQKPVAGKDKKKEGLLSVLFNTRSILLCLGGLLIIFICYKQNRSYNWVWSMLNSNWETIMKNPKATKDQRYEMKIGFLYSYCNYVKQNTPEDAIILFPDPEKIQEMEKKYNYHIDKRLTNKMELTYFVYPRKVLMNCEKETSPLYGKQTHVAIINGYGYENVNYPVDPKPDFNLLKIVTE